MKTCLLSVADESTDRTVRAALADLLAKRLISLKSEGVEALPQLTETNTETDILRAQQQPGSSLFEAKTQFGL